MEKYLFTKLSGAGNDFVLFDSRINSGLKLNPLKIRKICDRKYGVGGDGILLISDNPGVAFDVQYYNADGSGGTEPAAWRMASLGNSTASSPLRRRR